MREREGPRQHPQDPSPLTQGKLAIERVYDPSPARASAERPRGEAHAETAAIELRLQYYSYSDVPWSWPRLIQSTNSHSTGRAVRMHRFLTGREAGGIKPIRARCARLPPLTSAHFVLMCPRLADQRNPHSNCGHRVRPCTRVSRAGSWTARDERVRRMDVASPGNETRGGHVEAGLRCGAHRTHLG